MEDHKQYYREFLENCTTDDIEKEWDQWLKIQQQPSAYADHQEVIAMSEWLDANVIVYRHEYYRERDAVTITEQPGLHKVDGLPTLYLAYNSHNHYDSLVKSSHPVKILKKPSKNILSRYKQNEFTLQNQRIASVLGGSSQSACKALPRARPLTVSLPLPHTTEKSAQDPPLTLTQSVPEALIASPAQAPPLSLSQSVPEARLEAPPQAPLLTLSQPVSEARLEALPLPITQSSLHKAEESQQQHQSSNQSQAHPQTPASPSLTFCPLLLFQNHYHHHYQRESRYLENPPRQHRHDHLHVPIISSTQTLRSCQHGPPETIQ